MRKLTVLLFACLLLPRAEAVRVTPEQASVAARNWLRGGYGLERRMGTEVDSVRTFAGTNGAALHVAAVKGGGFVVLGSDTEDAPVVAVSAGGSGEPDERNPLWVLLRRDMAARQQARTVKRRTLKAAGLLKPTAGTTPQERWARLLEGDETDGPSSGGRKVLSASNGRTSLADVRVDALVKSAWSQEDYRNYGRTADGEICYNYYTPNHWPCGCVATAGAQLMRYHSYPTASVAAGTYACKINGSPVNLTMKGGTYDWNAMTLVPADGCSATSREAIGKLTYDVGVSVGMKYWSGSSSSPGYMLSKRFVDRFRYANAACVIFKDGFFKGGGYSYSLERLKAAVIPNFDAGLPVVLEVSGAGGHAVVGDGYGYSGGDFFIHINLGWANKDNGNVWYMPPDIDEYTVIDSVVYNVYPTGASGTSIVSGRVLGPDGAPVEGATVRVFVGEKETVVAKSNAKGIYAFRIAPCKCQVVAEKNGKSSGLDCDIVACISPKIDEDGLYWDSVCPQNGNLYGADMTLEGPDMPDPPPNDDFANAARLTGASGSVTVTNVGATPEANEPLQKSRPAATTTVWWKWTAPANGSMVIAEGGLADGNAFSTVMYAYTGTSLSSLTPVAAGGGPVSTCEFDCTSGTTYYICVAGDKGASGDIFLQWAFTGSSAPEWYYEKISDGGTICARIIAGAKKYAGDLAIPSTLDGYPVREIGAEAFLECVDLTSLTIPQSVSLIREGAFYNCRGLKSVTIPEGVTQIGPAAFAYCHVLEDVTLPSTLQWMGSQTFFNCMGLTEVSIPAGVEYIGVGAFSACANLETLRVEAGNPAYKAVGNALYSKDGRTLYHWPVSQHVTIPSGVRDIADYAYYCNDRAMSEDAVTIPGSVGHIGRYAFENRNIGSLTLQEGVESLDERAFCGNRMSQVVIPASVRSVGDLCFKSCTRLNKVAFLGDEPTFDGSAGLAGDGASSPAGVCVYVREDASGWRDGAGRQLGSWPRNVPYPCRVAVWDGTPGSFPRVGSLADELGTQVDVAHGEVAPYATAAATYDAYLYDGETVVGSVQVKIAKGKTDKKTGAVSASVTASVQLADGSEKLSFKGGVADGQGKVTAMADKNGNMLAVAVGVNGLGGTFRRSRSDTPYRIDGARNVFGGKSAADKSAIVRAQRYQGTYNVALEGRGTLSVTVDKKGKAKVSGNVGGNSVSATSQLLVGEGSAAVPVIIAKKVFLSFVLWLSADETADVCGGAAGVAGVPGRLEGGARFGLDAEGLAALPGHLYGDFLPTGLSVVQDGKKWVVAGGAKAGKLVLRDKTTGELDWNKSKFTGNMSGLKLSWKEKSGTFAGSFKVYAFEGGKIKSYTANVTGVMIGTKGYGTATVKGIGSFAVTISDGVSPDVPVAGDAEFCIVDLSGGASAGAYPVTYRTGAPADGWPDEYKTTKLVLRVIEPGVFAIGSPQEEDYNPPRQVTLTKPYCIGVFEVTQRQWELVMGSNPSYYEGAMRPVECVSYDMIRGDDKGALWPASSAVDATSFLGRLRARTGLNFDLPTQAQWECACRAGTMTTFSYGDTPDGDYMWYVGNSGEQTHDVGTRLPNPWGLYDMHGNVWEFCRDLGSELDYAETDPKGPVSGSGRAVRGGDCLNEVSGCASAAGGFWWLPFEWAISTGFRLSVDGE